MPHFELILNENLMKGRKVPSKTANHAKIVDSHNKIVKKIGHTEGRSTITCREEKIQSGQLHKQRTGVALALTKRGTTAPFGICGQLRHTKMQYSSYTK